MAYHENPRELAFEAYKRVVIDGAYSNLVLEKMLSETDLSSRDKALAAKITYGTLQWQGYIDYVLDALLKRPRAEMARDALFLLRQGAYQILFLHKVPARSAVDETVKLARKKTHKGIASLVNGTLRNLVRKHHEIVLPDMQLDPIKHLSIKYSHPHWMVEHWYHWLGAQKTEKLMQANNASPERSIRINTLKIAPESFISHLDDLGIHYEKNLRVPEGLIVYDYDKLLDTPLYEEGKFQPQDINAMLVSRLVAPREKEDVVDLCSAPGGKTTHMAQLMKNQGKILAVDVNKNKLKRVRAACESMGVTCVTTLLGDARNLFEANLVDETHHEGFDACLVDAPCSGLGTLRRRPELKWTINREDIDSLKNLQKELLETAHAFLKPGGRLVYSTCTVSKPENHHRMQDFLSHHPEYFVEDPRNLLSHEALYGADLSQTGLLQFYPDEGLGDGFFVARMEKQPNA